MKTKNTLLTFAMGLCFLVKAQTPILEEYVQEGLKSNLQLQQEQLSYEKSVENLNLAKALFLPQLSANASYSFANGGRKIAIPVGDLLNPVYSSLNQLTGTENFRQIGNQSQQFLPNDFHDTKLRVIQPLFNPDIYFNYKAQKELISVQVAQKNAYENELKYSITSAYYQFLQTEESLKILRDTRKLLQELLKINQRLVANDKATRDIVFNAQYELDKVEYQLTEAQKNNEVAKAYFNFLLNRDLSTAIEKDSTLSAYLAEQYNLDELTNSAWTKRQEIKQAEAGLMANEQLIGLSKGNAFFPKVSVVGDIGYQGFQYKFDGNQQYWLVQFSLTWDIFKGGEKKSRIQQAKIDYQIIDNRMQQLKKQIELQVIQTYREREAAQHSYITAQSGVRNAEKSFQIIRAKYNEGQALLLEYLDAQNKLTTSRMAEAIGSYELLRTEAALQKTIANL